MEVVYRNDNYRQREKCLIYGRERRKSKTGSGEGKLFNGFYGTDKGMRCGSDDIERVGS